MCTQHSHVSPAVGSGQDVPQLQEFCSTPILATDSSTTMDPPQLTIAVQPFAAAVYVLQSILAPLLEQLNCNIWIMDGLIHFKILSIWTSKRRVFFFLFYFFLVWF